MSRRPIIFLHLPKTAGQSVRIFLQNAFPRRSMFPGQIDHHLAMHSRSDLRQYDLFSGHFSWSALDCLGPDSFVFTVLRDPAERLISFYRFMRRQGAQLAPETRHQPANAGARLASELAFDEYMTTQEPGIQQYLLGTLDNFYMYYFATRVLNGRSLIRDVYPVTDSYATETVLQSAIRNIVESVRVYDFRNMAPMVDDLSREEGFVHTAFPTVNKAAEPSDNVALGQISNDLGRAREAIHMYCCHDQTIYRRFCA